MIKFLVSDKTGDHLPYTDASGNPDHRLMGAAWAALHGGYRGNKYDGPSKSAAVAKLTAVYKSEKMDTPQESDRFSVNGCEQLQESAYNPTTGKLKIRIIQSGFNKGKGRFYPADVLARDGKIFEGAKMFADHQTDQEAKNRPEGSVHNWVGQITNVRYDAGSTPPGLVGEAAVIDPPFKAKLEELNKQGLLSQMGISIRAAGIASPGRIDGHDTKVVEGLTMARSVDFVTYPGAGGQVEAIESETEVSLETITLSQLREARPDLVALLEFNEKEGQSMTPQEQIEFDALKSKVTALESAVSTEKAAKEVAVTENTNLKATAAKAAKIAEAQPLIAGLIKEANLPQPAADRLAKQFVTAESVTGVKEAIAAEVEYLKQVKAPAQVKNLGGTGDQGTGEVKEADIVAAFQGLGMTEAEAKVAARS